jgi:long-chain acyl-CoA synthetase
LATILYTSGTTGEPKGVMLTQANLVSNALAASEQFDIEPDEVRLSFLPLSHIFARTCDLYTWIETGVELALAESRETVIADCGLIRPTILNGVPYFFDRVYRALTQMGLADQPGSLRQLLGGRIKHCGSGGAALPDHIFDFFARQELPILQGYGLTETSPVISVSTLNENRRGAAGKAIADVEVKIGDDGEILTRGPHLMKGYWKSDADTAEMIRGGWLHTGDLGRVDEDGYVWITGRKKELIVTSAGKNVAPVLLESLLTKDSLIEQAMVIGDDRSFLTALIFPNITHVRQQLPSLSADLTDAQALLQPEVQELFTKRIEQCLTDVSYHEQVRRFTLLERPLSIEKGELTPKLSLRREVIQRHFADEIEQMYEKGE